jgi:hypothetical protein
MKIHQKSRGWIQIWKSSAPVHKGLAPVPMRPIFFGLFRNCLSYETWVIGQSPVHENGVCYTEVVLGTYRGRAKIYQGCGAWGSRLLAWKPVRKFEDCEITSAPHFDRVSLKSVYRRSSTKSILSLCSWKKCSPRTASTLESFCFCFCLCHRDTTNPTSRWRNCFYGHQQGWPFHLLRVCEGYRDFSPILYSISNESISSLRFRCGHDQRIALWGVGTANAKC